jgi:hypothetical protein
MSLADVIVLELHFGRNGTVELIGALNPWCYPDKTSKARIGIRVFAQITLDKVKEIGRKFEGFTEEIKPYTIRPPTSGKKLF